MAATDNDARQRGTHPHFSANAWITGPGVPLRMRSGPRPLCSSIPFGAIWCGSDTSFTAVDCRSLSPRPSAAPVPPSHLDRTPFQPSMSSCVRAAQMYLASCWPVTSSLTPHQGVRGIRQSATHKQNSRWERSVFRRVRAPPAVHLATLLFWRADCKLPWLQL